MSVLTIENRLREQALTVNANGNSVYRMFESSERYVVDFADDFNQEGWEQFDTDRDGWYFGVWVNRRKLLTMTYAEGDWTLVVCSDRESYLAEVKNLIASYGTTHYAVAIDMTTGSKTFYEQDRSTFLL